MTHLREGDRHFIVLWYRGRATTTQSLWARNTEPGKHTELEWCHWAALPTPTAPGFRDWLRQKLQQDRPCTGFHS